MLKLLMTEEDAKFKIVLPWLRERGVRLDELTFETTFRVQVGRRAVEVGSAAKRTGEAASGRLDVLVSRAGLNLLLVEVKQPGSELTDGDRDQAVSYARLVHPIAPLALVTNGEVYRLFDTLSKNEVAHDTPIRDGLSVSLPSSTRDEAVEIFLGLSRANLTTFCEAQLAEQLRPLVGSASDLSKVFVRELHVERRELHAHVDRFLRESDATAFVLLGESGAGKTSSMCQLVQDLSKRGQPVLFFRGLTIGARLLDAVADEFEWTFGEHQRPFELIKRIRAISPQAPLLIAVDAIEEWDYTERVPDLLSVLRHLSRRPCKLLLSCKTGSWDPFVNRKGDPTGLADYIFLPDNNTQSKSLSGYVLPPMSDTEFHWAVMNYRRVFDFHGVFDENAINEARRNPYLLRVFFDAAHNHKLPNLALTSRELLDAYYDRLLDRTSNRESAEATLLAVARAVWRANQAYITRDALREELKLGVNESIMRDLFDQNLLATENVGDARGPRIGFYFEPLRNYLIAYRVLNWPSFDGPELSRLATQSAGIEAEAFAYYFPQASVTQQRAVAGSVYATLEKYLSRYRTIVDAHFSHLRRSFEPRAKAQIGMVAELMLPTRRLGYFGFRAVRPDDSDVLFIPVKFKPSADFLFAHGVNQARMNSAIERGAGNDSEAVLQHEITPQLRLLVRHGELDESNAPELSRELLRGIINGRTDIFSALFDAHTHRLRYPIPLAAIDSILYRACLYEHFDHVRCEGQRRSGHVPETRSGQFVSYSWQPSAEDRAWIEQHVSETLHNAAAPEHLLTSVNSQCLLERVQRAIRNLGGESGSLEAPEPVEASGLTLWHASDRPRMDPAALSQAFALFYKAYLDVYQEVVGTSFPTLKSALPLYSELPVRVFVAVSHPHHWEHRSYPVLIAICPPQKGQDGNQVSAVDPAQISFESGRQLLLDGEPLEYSRLTRSDIGSQVRGYPSYLPDLLPVSNLVLRRKVYGTIESEIDPILAALLLLSGSRPKDAEVERTA